MDFKEHATVDFSGSKIAFLMDDQILVIRRDDRADIPFPDMWDLPGGGRDHQETPFECLKREVFEELGINISEEDIIWSRFYPSMKNPNQGSYFAVSYMDERQFKDIRFGDEGQGYRLMKIDDFLNDNRVIPFLKNRLRDYLREQ
jgi:8-oxo-dGTP diphosphatase